MVDAAKHMNRNIMTNWSENKLELADIGTSSKSFFVRIAGSKAAKAAMVEDAFGPVKYIELDEMDEFAVITGVMTENAFEEAAAKVKGIRGRIRVEAN